MTLCEDRDLYLLLVRLLAEAGFANAVQGNAAAAIALGCRQRIARNDLAAAQAQSQAGGGLPILLITSDGSEELAIEALRAGLADYLRLPLSHPELIRAVEAVVRIPDSPGATDRIVGASKAMATVKEYLRRAAACSSNVLITGETGTGKELAADFVHRHSRRADKPLIAINCAALPDNLIESELFGFERGAFTGAHAAQDGKLKLADGGTVFLDEIGDLSPFAQAKILRTIETGEIQRLGARRPQTVDIRLIAATNRDLDADAGFRRDLYFRLNVARIHLPPLRERKDDIEPLAQSFRREFDARFRCSTRAFAPGVTEMLLAYDWPGNIRELRNIIEAGFIDPGPDANQQIDLPPRFRQAVQGYSGGELERILATLSRTEWNRSQAAKELHWSRMTLYRKMARYSIKRASA